MSKNKLFKAFEQTLFQIALLHLIILLISSAWTTNLDHLNMVSILDLQFFFPDLQPTRTIGILTSIIVAAVFLINYRRSSVEEKGREPSHNKNKQGT